MGALVAIILALAVLVYLANRKGINIKDVITGKKTTNQDEIVNLTAKLTSLREEATRTEKIRELKTQINQTQEQIKKAKEN